jgi:hypothetical protein
MAAVRSGHPARAGTSPMPVSSRAMAYPAHPEPSLQSDEAQRTSPCSIANMAAAARVDAPILA